MGEATAESDSLTLTPCNRMVPIQIRKKNTRTAGDRGCIHI